MSSLIGFTNLSDVKPFKTGWRVRVKVLHSWKQYTAQSGQSLELILADETGSMIHATCKKNYIQRVERLVPVGEWKVIENFSLTSASGQYRPTSNNYKMAFTDNTSITKCNIKRTDEYIKLVDFDTILAGTLNNSFLVDVIGQVVDVKDLEGVQVSGKERKKIEFELRDSNDERMPCCLWERYADQLYTSCQEANGSMVICLIRFAKISSYRGKLQITNAFDTSKLMINPALPEVAEFQKALPDDGLALTIVEPKDDEAEKVVKKKEYWANLPQKTIEELLNSSEVNL